RLCRYRVVRWCVASSRRAPRSTRFPYTTLFRSVVVQAHAADELFERRQYAEAIAAATVVMQWQPVAEPRLLRSAALIIGHGEFEDRKSTRLNSSHVKISYAVFCLKKKTAHLRYE